MTPLSKLLYELKHTGLDEIILSKEASDNYEIKKNENGSYLAKKDNNKQIKGINKMERQQGMTVDGQIKCLNKLLEIIPVINKSEKLREDGQIIIDLNTVDITIHSTDIFYSDLKISLCNGSNQVRASVIGNNKDERISICTFDDYDTFLDFLKQRYDRP